ncbi:MAG: glycosyltransferase [Candidatus Jordarchaeaceae archaeon]
MLGLGGLVSVIIPTKNAEKYIALCLESVRNQTYPNVEVIVVDDFSKDRTVELAREFGARVIRVRAGRSEARNIGAKNSHGEFILSIDADMQLGFDAIEKCVSEALSGAEAVIIPEVADGQGFWAKCKCFERNLFIGEELVEVPRFFRRNVYWKLGGFDPQLEAGEDWDIAQRAREQGVAIKRIDSYMKHVEKNFNILRTIRREYQYTRSFYHYVSKHPQLVKQQAWVYWKVLAQKRKELMRNLAYTLGLFTIKFFEAVAHIIGFFKAIILYKLQTLNMGTAKTELAVKQAGKSTTELSLL